MFIKHTSYIKRLVCINDIKVKQSITESVLNDSFHCRTGTAVGGVSVSGRAVIGVTRLQ